MRYSPSAAFQVSGITQPFRGANAYRPNLIGDPLAPRGERSITNYLNKANVVLPTDLNHGAYMGNGFGIRAQDRK